MKEATTTGRMEPKDTRRVVTVGQFARLERRVLGLEGRMTTLETAAITAADNTREILDLYRAGKSAAGYVKRYGPKVILFTSGLLTAAGIGNPHISAFLQNFFGG